MAEVVLAREEVDKIIEKLRSPYDLVVKLLYGCGLRLFEALNIRIQCLDFSENILTIHDGKGLKDRTLPLPMTILPELQAHVEKLKVLHQSDLEANYDIRTIQKMLGHTDVRTTMIYTNTVCSRTLHEQKSPLDF